jgi:secretory carrier-associated membrane protein
MCCRAWCLWLHTVFALLYNLAGVAIAVCSIRVINAATAVIIAIIFALCGIPGSKLLWHSPIYRGLMHDRALSLGAFFFGFLIHIVFCSWSAVSPFSIGDAESDVIFGFGIAHVGILPGIQFIKDRRFGFGYLLVGIVYFSGAFIWGSLACMSMWYMTKVYALVRGRA